MRAILPISIDDVNEWLEYKEGHLYWKKKRKNGAGPTIGKRFGTPDKDGYICGTLLGKQYKEHRLIFALHNNGDCPDSIDHINRIKGDNHIENLRIASPLLNVLNRPLSKNNKSGYKGVSWCKVMNKWVAVTKINYKKHTINYSDCKHAAAKSYNEFTFKQWGNQAYINKIKECNCDDCTKG